MGKELTKEELLFMDAQWFRKELHNILAKYGVEPELKRAQCGLEILTLQVKMIVEA